MGQNPDEMSDRGADLARECRFQVSGVRLPRQRHFGFSDEGKFGSIELKIDIALHFASGRVIKSAHDAEERGAAFLVFQTDAKEFIAGVEERAFFTGGDGIFFIFAGDDGVIILAGRDWEGIDDDERVEASLLDDVKPGGIGQFGSGAAKIADQFCGRLKILRAEFGVANGLGGSQAAGQSQKKKNRDNQSCFHKNPFLNILSDVCAGLSAADITVRVIDSDGDDVGPRIGEGDRDLEILVF